MVNEYKVLSDFSLEHLISSVNSSIQQGWQPLGGISITHTKLNSDQEVDGKGKATIIYVQAMVK